MGLEEPGIRYLEREQWIAAKLPKYDNPAIDVITIILLYIFFPLGVIFAIPRMSEKQNYRKPAKFRLATHLLAGVVLFIFVVTILEWDLLPLLIPSIVGAVITAGLARNSRKMYSKLVAKYLYLIHEEHITSIPALAMYTLQTEYKVKHDLEYLQKHKVLEPWLFFTNEFVDNISPYVPPAPPMTESVQTAVPERKENRQETEVKSAQKKMQNKQNKQRPAVKARHPKTVYCTSCGAPSTLEPDEASACEYCGTMVMYK